MFEQQITVGTKFTVTKIYGKKTFTVIHIDTEDFDGAGITADAGDGVKYWFPFGTLDYYHSIKLLKVLSLAPAQGFAAEVEAENRQFEAKGYGLDKLIEAKTQLVGFFVTLHNEDIGSRWMAAVEKAYTELVKNDSIQFDGKRLTFTSRFSGKQRIVTRFGCHESCECRGTISYHLALFELLRRYHKAVNNVRRLPVRQARVLAEAA